MLKNGEYGQLFFMRIDMVNSERIMSDASPGRYRSISSAYTGLVEREVKVWGGIVGSWQGDGAVAFLGTTGDEDDIMRSGEAMARSILGGLFKILPEARFRIGAASAPARFWQDVDRMIKSMGVVQAARLEDEARDFASGSSLLIPGDIYMVLDDSVKVLYKHVNTQWGSHDAYLYVPAGAGQILPKAGLSVEPKKAPAVSGGKINFFTLFDSDWVFKDSTVPYVAFAAHPSAAEKRLFDLSRHHKAWILERFSALFVGKPVFTNEDIELNRFTVYHAKDINSRKMQVLRFYDNGVFVFADSIWSMRPEWKGFFYPESIRLFIPGVMRFASDYYNNCLDYKSRVRIMLHVVNVSGCKRKTSTTAGQTPQAFTYDSDICATINVFPGEMISRESMRFLYNQIISQSNLDVETWGLD